MLNGSWTGVCVRVISFLSIQIRSLVALIKITQPYHQDRRHWQRQQHTGKAKQLATSKNGKYYSYRMQTNTVPHQQRCQRNRLKHLAYQEHANNASEHQIVQPKLEKPGNQGNTNTNDEAHIGHNTARPATTPISKP